LAPQPSPGQEISLLESIVDGQNASIELSSEEQGLKHVISEFGHGTNKSEKRVEHRINKFEKTVKHRITKVEQSVRNLQIGWVAPHTKDFEKSLTNRYKLEEEKTRLCNEIDAHIEKLQAWAALIKDFVDRVTESN
jgi:hypothetical protein